MKPGFIALLLLNVWLLFSVHLCCCQEETSTVSNDEEGPSEIEKERAREKQEQQMHDFTVGTDLEERARIIMVDGNVYFYAGTKRNISFIPSKGGGIYLGGVDVRLLPNNTQIETLNLLLGSNSDVLKTLRESISSTSRQIPLMRREMNGIRARQLAMNALIRRMNDTRTRNRNTRRLRMTITRLSTQVDRLFKLMKTNECLLAPCKNGGTCLDLFGDYKCLCPRHFIGRNCHEREDECKMYSGTHAGCQNGATCENNKNITGFTCHCTKGWHGPLCQFEQSTCSKSSNLCGDHGQCVDRQNNDKISYDCICEWGYKKTNDPINPTCIDIDECVASPCYPGSNCLNFDGGFKCESCPAGFVGNGINCADFDECASTMTNDCSKHPEVECINTIGSYRCGNCPAGYIGDGFKCTKQKFCESDPCASNARCLEHELACMCPYEYTGDGLKGGTGCRYNYYYECSIVCENGGSCRGVASSGSKYNVATCFCPLGFYGSRCQFEDLCVQSDYCNNRGTCLRNGNTATCDCYDGYYGDRCETSETPGCSFHTGNETGFVDFRAAETSTTSLINANNVTVAPACAWIIHLRDTRKIIELWFEYFKQEDINTTICDNRDSLIVYDASIKPIDMLVDICTDDQLPRNNTPIYSSSNTLNINYFFVNTNNKSQIKMYWKAVEPICGGRLIQDSATLEYTSSRAFEHCLWYISVRGGFYLEVTVESFITVSGQYRNCSINSLELYDDSFLGEDAHQSMQTCQTETQRFTRRLSGRNAVLKLSYDSYNATADHLKECQMQTDSDNNTDKTPICKVYFRVSYKSIPLPDNCGGEIKLLNPTSLSDDDNSIGYIESPNYDHSYFPNLNCMWNLDASNAFNNTMIQDYGMIRLEFVDLDVDSDGMGKGLFGKTNCPGDYIKISTRPGERFCNAYPPKIEYAKENVKVEFVTTGQSRYKSRGRGFRIKYQAICYQELSGENGTIQSPNYRVPSDVPFKCHYHIAASPTASIQLSFDYIGLKPFSLACIHPRFARNMTDDYIEFNGGHSSNIPINKRYYCPRYPFSTPNGEIVASSPNGLSFVYSTSGDKDNTGFLFRYYIQNIGCGGYQIGTKGTIKSPNYPLPYPSNMYCIYTLLLMTDNMEETVKTHGIRLTFDEFKVENIPSNREECTFDYVKVYEFYHNEDKHGKLLGNFCGFKAPPPILSQLSSMAVVFISDRSVASPGFTAHWEAVDLRADCNRVFSEPSGVIEFKSEDFRAVSTCDYQIVLPSMQRVELFIENVTMPCDEGRIMFRNGGEETSPAFPDLFGNSEMCNGQVVPRLQSQGNQVFIRLTIQNQANANFRIRYEQIASSCGGYIRGFGGAISTPQYPQQDSRALQCEWQIAVALGNKIRLQFIKIDNLESSDRSGLCSPFARNYIDILGDSTPDAHVLKRYCRTETSPDPIDSDDNQMVVRYNQNGGSINGGLYGFLAEYQTVCEDIYLEGSHGSIQSPGYPKPVTQSRNCRWKITTTPGSYIKVTFHSFNINSPYSIIWNTRRTCLGDFLAVDIKQVNHTVGTKQDITYTNLNETRFCNQIAKPVTIYSKSNELEFKFQSSNNPQNNFWLSWSKIGCGGPVTKNNTKLTALNSDFVDANLSPERECQWIVKAPIGYVPQIQVSQLYTETSLDKSDKPCLRNASDPDTFSGLEIFYGTEPSDYVQQEICGIEHDTVFTAHSNEVLMRLRFDGKRPNSRNGTIMEAIVIFVKSPMNNTCGAVVYVKPGENTTIHSPNYPKPYPRAIECIWQFETEKGYTISYNLKNYSTPNQHAKKVSGILRPGLNTRCSYALGHIEGNIAFYGSQYDKSQSMNMYGMTKAGAIQRICVDIDEPTLIESKSNVSSVVFNGAPYEASVQSGVSTKTMTTGFELEVFTVCGGTLHAGQTRRIFTITNKSLQNKNNMTCIFNIEKEDSTDTESTMYVNFELVAQTYESSNESNFQMLALCGNDAWAIQLTHEEDFSQTGKTWFSGRRNTYRFKCSKEIILHFMTTELDPSVQLVITYDTRSQFCGGQFLGAKGTVDMGRLDGNYDCVWNLTAWPGNTVEVKIGDSYIEPSEYCAQSYLELRKENASGKLIARRCGEISGFTFSGNSLFMRLKRVVEEEDDEEVVGDGIATDEQDNEIASETIATKPPEFKFSYKYKFGGYTNDHVIKIPSKILDYVDRRNPDNERIAWLLTTRNSTSRIQLIVVSRYNVDLEFLNYHCPSPCLESQQEGKGGSKLFSSTENGMEEKHAFVFNSNVLTILATNLNYGSKFHIRWDELPPSDPNNRQETGGYYAGPSGSEFRKCGGILNPTYTPQSFSLPVNTDGYYKDGLRCKWTLKRPMLSSIIFTLKKLDLEDHPECLYDYIIIANKNYETLEDLSKSPYTHYCRKDQVDIEASVNYDDTAYVYFVSDRSRSFSGFTLEYRIGCRTFEFIPSSNGVLDMVLESPMYSDTSKYNFSCLWGIMLESNRDVMITSLDMDLAPKAANGSCSEDVLKIGDFPSTLNPLRRVGEFCGNEPFNFTAKTGRVYIQFDKPAQKELRRGYKLRISEVVHGCASQTLHVDEFTKKATLTSPEFPGLAPNSLDCRWTLSVPVGHQLKFTMDPHNFNLQNSDDNNCVDDYIEIHDGASEGAPLIGKYCNQNAPSTIISSDSHLFVRFVTDNYSPSFGWNATYELASCGGTVVLQEGVNTTIQSTHYPDVYPAKEDCEWIIRPPKAHFVYAKFNHMWLFVTDNCTNDYISLREDNSTGPYVISPLCTYRNINQTGYYLNGNGYLKFHSNSTIKATNRAWCLNRKCGFEMEFAASKFECGGLITDEEGEVYLQTTGRNQIVPGLKCKWDLRAGIGFRYKIDFFWLDEDEQNHGFYHRTNLYTENPLDWCLPDLEIWNGLQGNRYNLFGMHQRFCRNRTSFVSASDIVSMQYEDNSDYYNMYYRGYHQINETRFRQPFGFKYTKIDADYDTNYCMYHVMEDTQISIQNMKFDSKSLARDYNAVVGQTRSFCHIRIDNPSRYTTYTLAFSNFSAGRQDTQICGTTDNKVIVTDSGTNNWPINEVLCTANVKTGNISYVYNHPSIDIYAQNNPFVYLPLHDGTVNFNLSVQYHACGGLITEDDDNGNSGTITSPGWLRGNYTNGADCLWTLQAPEGKVVILNITFMDIDYHPACALDFLEVSEGQDRHAVIMRYCYDLSDEEHFLPDRHRLIKTRGRYLTMYFHSDETVSRRGFTANWEFASYDNNSCGFVAHSKTGFIHSPNYPNDYPADLFCQWAVVVPQGHHIKVTFERVDIEESDECENDKLSIAQEHQSRENDPLNSYFFYYDHEQMLNETCGSNTPKPIITEANQIRLNFTTNSKISGSGFKLKWEAECGTVFRTSHGVVTSPFYPKYYPNDNFECKYLIDPESDGVQIVTLRLMDFDLDTTLVSTSRECNSDYLEVRDVIRDVVLQTVCGDVVSDSEAGLLFSVKGPIGLRFVSNTSMLHDFVNKRKNHRGFKLTYALSDCGGEVNLGEANHRLAGSVNSPGFPLPYHDDMDCVWNVTAPEGYVIAIKFTAIDIEISPNCTFDYVEVFDGETMSNGTSMGRLCGPQPPEGHRRTLSSKAVLHFVSDHSSTSSGFMAVLTATLGADKGCGGELNATKDPQKLFSPSDSETNTYLNNLRCMWKISTQPGKVIELKIISFVMEKRHRANNMSHCYDFLAIYDGPSTLSPFLLRPNCEFPQNTIFPIVLYSSYHALEIYFESDYSDSSNGFEIEYRSITDGCTNEIYVAQPEPTLLAYTSEKTTTRVNQHRQRCRFFIRTKENEPIEINFSLFNFPSKSVDCLDEYLEIRDVGSTAECQHPACATQQSQVDNVVRTCGRRVPPRFVSKTALVQIVTSVLLQSQFTATFELNYKLLDSCNRTIQVSTGFERWASGHITSPNFPNAYDHNSTCTTKIIVPKNQRIFIIFKSFSLERGRYRALNVREKRMLSPSNRLGWRQRFPLTCTNDKLMIMYNESDYSQNDTYCGWASPPARISPNNSVTMQLVTDGTYALNGYSAYYYTVKITEDRETNKTFYNFATIYEPNGYLASLGFPGYPQNTVQRWTVVPPAGMACAVRILTYMSKLRSCSSDEKAKWAHYLGEAPDRWIDLPCFDPYNAIPYNLTAGEKMMFEVTTDEYAYNNGLGFRVYWNCANLGTPVFMVDQWEGSPDV